MEGWQESTNGDEEHLGAVAQNSREQHISRDSGHPNTICISIPQTIPGLKGLEDENGYLPLESIGHWIKNVSRDVLFNHQDFIRKLAELINDKDGNLAKALLKRLRDSMKSEVDLVSKENPEAITERNSKRPLDDNDETPDDTEISVVEETLLFNGYTSVEYHRARETLLTNGTDLNNASATDYFDVLDAREKTSKSKRTKICQNCTATLDDCPEGCGKHV